MKTLTCKKDLIGNRTFRKNKEYEISYYKHDSCFMLTDEYTNDPTELKGLWFGKPFSHALYDYFYTEKELRQQKLKKLQNDTNY
mgnify:CR=1 FL=1